MTVATKTETALRIEDLTVSLNRPDGTRVPVVEGVSLSLSRGEVMGLVGESGCGKSVTAQAVMGVLSGNMQITGGRIWLGDKEMTAMPERALRQLRGRDIAMIFQDPMSSLNPLITIGKQIAETLIIHGIANRRTARARALDLLKLVRIPSPEARMDEFPHRLSGGMRQRVMIAIALACDPAVLIADEPTTALDVTIQRQILSLLGELQDKLGVAVLMITHDFGVVREFADSVTVMYAGKVVEQAASDRLFADPRHPYSRKLLAAMPHFSREVTDADRARLVEIPGIVPSIGQRPAGCNFNPRCDRATELCGTREPVTEPCGPSHTVACFHHGEPDAAH